MSRGSLKGKRRRTKGSRSLLEVLRALIATAAVAGILLLAVFVTSSSYFADPQTKNAAAKIAPLSQSGGGEAEHRVAAIVVETDRKGRCEERSFDNRTGKIVSSSVVDCEARLAAERDTTPSENLSAERMRSILGAFKR
jgi:hypothetical protein